MIDWRAKFRAFGIHFLATLAVALVAAALIFLVWYPDPFQEMVGGSKLFLLLIGCDLALGPLISLVVYDRRKSRRELTLDYSLVALIQLGALVYGMYVSFNARPLYVVFVQDRLEVVTSNEIAEEDLAEARLAQFRRRPLWGPELAGTDVRPEERDNALEHALAGKDVHVRPKFYVPYEAKEARILEKARPLADLYRRHPEAEAAVKRVRADAQATDKWLPVRHKNGFWTVLIDERGRPASYAPVDPY
jgi:hypothetical protein